MQQPASNEIEWSVEISACLLLLLRVPHSSATFVINKKNGKFPIAVVCRVNRVVREKATVGGEYHGQLKLRNSKLLPFRGVSEIYYAVTHFDLRKGQTVAPNILSLPTFL